MTGLPAETDDSLDQAISDYVTPEVTTISAPAKREFAPWHKPRKQIVRRSWAYNVSRLMGELEHPQGSPQVFRYLTLPGPEMLDVRNLRSVCATRGYKLKFVGFHPAAKGTPTEQQLTLAQNQLRNQDWIDESSKILWYRLEDLAASEDPVAFRGAYDHGPYHAINFDLCNNIAYRNGGAPGALDALGKLIQLQTLKCNHDWLLFIATKVEKTTVATQCLDAFVAAIRANAATSAEFAAALDDLFHARGQDAQSALSLPTSMPDDVFKDLFCIGIGKWLLQYLSTANPPHRLQMLRSYFHSVDGHRPDMLSLVFKCSVGQQPAVDPAQLVAATPNRQPNTEEVKLALRILAKTGDLVDLDSVVSGNKELLGELIDEMTSLLQDANYDKATLDGYSAFALGGEEEAGEIADDAADNSLSPSC